MVVGVLQMDLRLHDPQSLKQKRSCINRILARIRARHPVSIAEVGHQDLRQRTLLGAAMAAGTEAQIAKVFNAIEDDFEQTGQAESINTEREFLHYGDVSP